MQFTMRRGRRTRSLVTGVIAAGALFTLGVTSAPPALACEPLPSCQLEGQALPAVEPPGQAPETDTMSEGADGSTVLVTSANTSSGPTSKLFDYTIDFKVRVRGRNMPHSTDYCNYFHSTYVQHPELEDGVRISLWQDVSFATDRQVGVKITYPVNGITYGYCWRGFNSSNTYYFTYEKNNNTYIIRGAGGVNNGS